MKLFDVLVHFSQIIRYDLGGEPLWVSNENIPTKDEISDCSCGAKRQFEFQVNIF